MPSRMIDFDALWASEKLAACQSSMRVEYLWLYGLADAYGSFELNLRAIHSKVAAIRPRLTLQRVEKLFAEFERQGLLFTWRENGKRYGHWTGSDRPGRLPKPSERHRYKKLATDVPKEQLSAYVSRFSRDPLATASPLGVGVGVEFDLIGDGKESGIGSAPSARGVGATATPAAKPAAISSAFPESISISKSTATVTPPASKKSTQAHPRQRQLFCPDCEKGFDDTSELLRHECSAKTAGGFECKWCHSTFKDHRGLKDHRSHCVRGL